MDTNHSTYTATNLLVSLKELCNVDGDMSRRPPANYSPMENAHMRGLNVLAYQLMNYVDSDHDLYCI